MRYQEITKLMESEPVPKLSSLWRYSDEFSPEANERARQSAMREIENIRARNKQTATDNRALRAGFVPKSFDTFGINVREFMKDYCASLYEFLVANPKYVTEYVNDMTGVTPDNIFTALVKHDGTSDAVFAVVSEALSNPGPEVEAKYQAQLAPYMAYRKAISQLGPVGRARAQTALHDEIRASFA